MVEYYLEEIGKRRYVVMVDGESVGQVWAEKLPGWKPQAWYADAGRETYGPYKTRKKAIEELTGPGSRELSKPQYLLICLIARWGLPEPDREVRFTTKQAWRFDLAWKPQRVALEIDGGAYSGGRHVRGKGFEQDCEKLNEALLEGWRPFRVTPQQIERDPARVEETLRRALETR
jgi:hypothetical protein